ncbi:hypothetical protein HH214_12070 [Mucilaginibacter robiniae]|uniref:Uncharacterized protein n=1 Tax=Mucilaginibacter robiniae TaxID=2728022 RepID=A0A7L5E0K6_9SPHI|nr:hypothetical protein [Mucilaginibacter robiniae]QJD96561.1 hypothetical protein HH214_12070 [Mucilaginibacter robiniae]
MDVENNFEPNKKVSFSNSFSLLLKLAPANFKRSYGYLLTVKDGEHENTLKYEVDITYIKTIPEKARLFELKRTSKVYINDMEPDLLIDQLAYEAGSVIYPLVVEIDFDGKFLAIHNYEEIKNRWQVKRKQITSYFTGEEAEKYCKLMDKTIASESKLNWSLAKDYLISTYFSPIYKSYTSKLEITEPNAFPLAGKAQPVAFQITQQVQENLNELNAIELWHGGVTSDERSALDVEQEQDFPLNRGVDESLNAVEGQYTARYLLHANTKAIRSINAEWKLSLRMPLIITLSLYETQPNNTPTQSQNNDSYNSLLLLDKEEPTTLLGSIWKSLFGG